MSKHTILLFIFILIHSCVSKKENKGAEVTENDGNKSTIDPNLPAIVSENLFKTQDSKGVYLIDVLCGFTPNAKIQLTNLTPEALCLREIEEVNGRLIDSQITTIKLRDVGLIHFTDKDFTRTTKFPVMNNAATNLYSSVNWFAPYTKAYGADMSLAFFSSSEGFGSVNIAFVGGMGSYTVAAVGVSFNYTPHEVGHMVGGSHCRKVAAGEAEHHKYGHNIGGYNSSGFPNQAYFNKPWTISGTTQCYTWNTDNAIKKFSNPEMSVNWPFTYVGSNKNGPIGDSQYSNMAKVWRDHVLNYQNNSGSALIKNKAPRIPVEINSMYYSDDCIQVYSEYDYRGSFESHCNEGVFNVSGVVKSLRIPKGKLVSISNIQNIGGSPIIIASSIYNLDFFFSSLNLTGYYVASISFYDPNVVSSLAENNMLQSDMVGAKYEYAFTEEEINCEEATLASGIIVYGNFEGIELICDNNVTEKTFGQKVEKDTLLECENSIENIEVYHDDWITGLEITCSDGTIQSFKQGDSKSSDAHCPQGYDIDGLKVQLIKNYKYPYRLAVKCG